MKNSIVLSIALMTPLITVSHAAVGNFTPDITSDKCWNDYFVYVGQVIPDTAVRSAVTVRVVTAISGQVAGQKSIAGNIYLTERTAAIDGWVGEASPIKFGTNLLIFEPKRTRARIPATLNTSGSLVRSLQRIAELHSNPDIQTLFRSVLSKDDLVSEYCLRRLLEPEAPSLTGTDATPDYLAHLKMLKEDQTHTPKVRMLAEQLFLKLSGEPLGSEAEFQWLSHAIADSPNQVPDLHSLDGEPKYPKGTEVDAWLFRLRDMFSRDEKTIVFLTGVVSDKKAPLGARSRVLELCTSFPINQLSRDQHEKMFVTCLNMLKDKNVQIRMKAASSLRVLVISLGPLLPDGPGHIPEDVKQRALKGLRAALKTEKDAGVIFYLNQSLNSIQQ